MGKQSAYKSTLVVGVLHSTPRGQDKWHSQNTTSRSSNYWVLTLLDKGHSGSTFQRLKKKRWVQVYTSTPPPPSADESEHQEFFTEENAKTGGALQTSFPS